MEHGVPSCDEKAIAGGLGNARRKKVTAVLDGCNGGPAAPSWVGETDVLRVEPLVFWPDDSSVPAWVGATSAVVAGTRVCSEEAAGKDDALTLPAGVPAQRVSANALAADLVTIPMKGPRI